MTKQAITNGVYISVFFIVGFLFIRLITYAIKNPIENVVQIIKFTTVEYLKEDRSKDFPLLIFRYANFPSIQRAIRNATINPIVETS